jgi:DNA-binding MarR family transcriptional regulator
VLTDAGQAIWFDIQHCGERVRARAMQGLNDGEREQLFRLLNQVLQNLTPLPANDE